MLYSMGSLQVNSSVVTAKPKEMNLDYVSSMPSQKYLYRGDNCQLMMKRNFSTDAITSTPVFSQISSQLTVEQPLLHMKNVNNVPKTTSFTSFVGNALTGILTSIFGHKKVTPQQPQLPPFEYQLNENHMKHMDKSTYENNKQKILTIFDPKTTSDTPEIGSMFENADPYLRFMDSPTEIKKIPSFENPRTQDLPTKSPEKTEVVEKIKVNLNRDCEQSPPSVHEEVHEHKKRAKWIHSKPKPIKSTTSSTDTTLHSPSSFRHSHYKCPNKNRKEKVRHEIIWNIREDLSGEEDEEDFEEVVSDGEYTLANDECVSPTKLEICKTTTLFRKLFDNINNCDKTPDTNNTNKTEINNCVPSLSNSNEFPSIPAPTTTVTLQCKQNNQKSNNNNNNYRLPRECSECDSEDNFIVFSNDTTTNTPESSYTSSPEKQSRCKKITDSVLRLKRLNLLRQRQRYSSECSDDSFVVCFESAPGETRDDVKWSDHESDSEEVSSSDEESELDVNDDSETEDEDVAFDGAKIYQVDSGFEEKKVS
jgi:hypothetical protein